MLSLFIAFFLGNSFLTRCSQFGPALRTVVSALLCIAIMVMPLLVVIYLAPYDVHCKTRFDRDWKGETPEWCYEKFPNCYAYIQLKYWDNRFLGFLYRGLENFLTSLPMSLVYLTVTYRVISANPIAFFSFGIFGCKPQDKERNMTNAVLESVEIIPHAWYFAI